jgi:tRNA(Phe) wybutosine-synthesizing methylase Tyw3
MFCSSRFGFFRSLSLEAITQIVSDRHFKNQKQEILQDLHENKNDKSLAGKVDPRILEMVNLINSKECFYTTSSCSGRISLFHRENPNELSENLMEEQQKTTGKKRGSGRGTIFQSHDPLPLDCSSALEECWNQLQIENNSSSLSCPRGTVELKFEPLILHVRCRDLISAQKLLDAAAGAGLRKSGLIAPIIKFPLVGEERDLLKSLDLTSLTTTSSSSTQSENEEKASKNFVLGHNFLVSIGSTAGVNNIVCLQGEMLTRKEDFHTLLKYFNEKLLMGENEKRKELLFERIEKL